MLEFERGGKVEYRFTIPFVAWEGHGTTFDFYVVRSSRSNSGPRQKVCGYIGRIEERFLNVPAHRAIFWETRTIHDGTYRQGARELIRKIVAAEAEKDAEVDKLVRMAERYVEPLF